MIPARISPGTAGRLRRSKISPSIFVVTKMTKSSSSSCSVPVGSVVAILALTEAYEKAELHATKLESWICRTEAASRAACQALFGAKMGEQLSTTNDTKGHEGKLTTRD